MKIEKRVVEVEVADKQPRCVKVAEKGIRNQDHLADFLSDLMADVASRRIMPVASNAMCNIAGKMLKNLDLRMKYGGSLPTPAALVTPAEEE